MLRALALAGLLSWVLVTSPASRAEAGGEIPPRFELTAYLAGASLHHMDAVGDFVVVARGDTVESWHVASEEARGSVVLPGRVSSLRIERLDGDRADRGGVPRERRVLVQIRGDFHVLMLGVHGGLRSLASTTKEELFPPRTPPGPSFSIRPAFVATQGTVYAALTEFSGPGSSWSHLFVLDIAPNGELGKVTEVPLGEGAVERMCLDGDVLFVLHPIDGRYGIVDARVSAVDVGRRQAPRVRPLDLRLPDGGPVPLAEVAAMVWDGRSLWLSERARGAPYADPERPDSLQRFVLEPAGRATRRAYWPLDRPVRDLGWTDRGLVALMGDPYAAEASELWLLEGEGARGPDHRLVVPLEPGATALSQTQGRTVVATLGGDLLLLELGPEGPPRARRRLGGPGPVYGVAATHTRAAVLQQEAGGVEVVLLDMTDPWRPRTAARVPGVSYAAAVALRGHRLAIVEAGEILLFDVRDPAAPVELGSLEWRLRGNREAIQSVVWRSAHVLVVSGGVWLGVIDTSDPRQPRPLASWRHGAEGGDLLAVEGAMAIVGSSRGTRIAVQDLDAPAEVVPFAFELAAPCVTSRCPTRLALREGQAWVTHGRWLHVYNLDLPSRQARRLAGHLVEQGRGAGPIDVARVADALLLARGHDLEVFEVAPAGRIELRQSLRMPGSSRQLTAAGNLVFVAGGDSGLSVLRRLPGELPWRVALPWTAVGVE